MISRKKLLASVVLLLAWGILALPASALPSFQVYGEGATPGTIGQDEQTWFLNGNDFKLLVSASYGANDVSIDYVTLLLSVPKGEQGTISITSPFDEAPVLITGRGGIVDGVFDGYPLVNPNADSDIMVLTDEPSPNGYGTKDFLPEGVRFNNHHPFAEGVSDFVLFSLGSFDPVESPLNDYNADDGTITEAGNSVGEVKEYEVSFTGFSQVHFDVYGAIQTDKGNTVVRTTWDWDVNPGSHDTTVITTVPIPGATVLGMLGLAVLPGIRKRWSTRSK